MQFFWWITLRFASRDRKPKGVETSPWVKSGSKAMGIAVLLIHLGVMFSVNILFCYNVIY